MHLGVAVTYYFLENALIGQNGELLSICSPFSNSMKNDTFHK